MHLDRGGQPARAHLVETTGEEQLHALRDPAVNEAAARRSNSAVGHFADAIVAEIPSLVRLDADDVPAPELVDGADEPVLFEVAGLGENVEPEIAPESGRDEWERFVAIQIDAREGMSMYPRLLPGATVLVDRHYNSLKPYRKGESNMYAVNKNEFCTVRYVEVAGKHLVLRPHNNAYPVEVMPIQHGKKPPDYLIGRICYVGIET